MQSCQQFVVFEWDSGYHVLCTVTNTIVFEVFVNELQIICSSYVAFVVGMSSSVHMNVESNVIH